VTVSVTHLLYNEFTTGQGGAMVMEKVIEEYLKRAKVAGKEFGGRIFIQN